MLSFRFAVLWCHVVTLANQCCKEIISYILAVFNIFYLVSNGEKNHIMHQLRKGLHKHSVEKLVIELHK